MKTVSLDGFVNEHGLQRIDCIKMDVEGSEMDALCLAQSKLSKNIVRLFLSACIRLLIIKSKKDSARFGMC